MKKKEKLILTGITMLFGTIFNLFFTAMLHGLLSREYATLTWIPVTKCIIGLSTQRQQLLLFLSFEGFFALCCILFWIQNSHAYQSELVHVAGDIYTPASVGQFQHGSSRWLLEKEKDQVFKTQMISPEHPVIKMLLETGYDNLPFLSEQGGKKGSKSEQKTVGEKDPEKSEQKEIRQGILETDKTEDSLPVSINEENQEGGDAFESVEYDVLPKPHSDHEGPLPEAKADAAPGAKKDPYQLFSSGGIVIGKKLDNC